MSKRFIDISPMRSDLLKMLEEKFLATEHFNSDTINVSLSLKETVDKVVEANKLAEPEIFILDKAWLKIQMLVKENSGEVAWHCLVEKHPNNKYLIYDVLVFPQEVTGATADGIDGEYEMWLATLPDEQFDFCRCHMHSHVNMGVTPSATDEGYYANLMTQVTDYYITMIINKSHQYHLRFYDKQNNLVWSELEFNICDSTGNTYENWYESVKGNIKTKTYGTLANRQRSIYDYDSDYTSLYSSKKKETTEEKSGTRTTQTMNLVGGTTTPKEKEFIINSPTNECLVFTDVNDATNYIYEYYESKGLIKDYRAFQRNHIRTRLARKKICIINNVTLEFIDDADIDDGILAYAVHVGDIWEVIE
jgi:hypothetical protein